jgi:hypothetical protein
MISSKYGILLCHVKFYLAAGTVIHRKLRYAVCMLDRRVGNRTFWYTVHYVEELYEQGCKGKYSLSIAGITEAIVSNKA